MRSAFVVTWCLFGLSLGSLYIDLFKSLVSSKDRSISNVIKNLPKDLVGELENSEQEAGQFICDVLINHNVPAALEDLGKDLWNEIEGDWSAVTDVIESLPTLAPEVLKDIIQDGKDVVSVVDEVITNPKAVLTLIEGGIETVVTDVESVVGGIITDIECLFGDCNKGTVTTAVDPAATLTKSCKSILSVASTTSHGAPAATTAPTLKPASANPKATATQTLITSSKAVAEATSTGGVVAPGTGTSGSTGSEHIRRPVLQLWAGLLVPFIVAIIAL